MPLNYHCCICKQSLPMDGPQQHRLDPCALVVGGNADKVWREQREQQFWRHFECFRKLLGDGGVLYIKDEDFPANGEAEDEREAEGHGDVIEGE